MPVRTDIHLYNESVRLEHTQWTDYSTQQSFSVATDPTVPSAPTIAVNAATGAVAVEIPAPTTNTDGTSIVDILEYKIYYDPTDSIDITASGTYQDPPYTIAGTAKMIPATVQTYVVVTCIDKWGNESAASNEENATPTGIDPSDDGLWAHRMGDAATWTEDDPDSNSVSWASVILYWKDNAYTITNGNTSNKYIWWDYSTSTTTFQTTDTAPTLEKEDCLIAYNDSGTLHLMIYRPMFMGDYMRAGVITSINWDASTGSEIDLDNGTIKLGGSSSPGFSAAANGDLSLGTSFVWVASTTSLSMFGTLNTASAGSNRVYLESDDLQIHDANYARWSFDIDGCTLLSSAGATLGYIPTSTDVGGADREANPYFSHNRVTIDNTLVVGTNASTPSIGSHALYVSGTSEITSTLLVGDHGAAATPSVVNVVYGTGSAPTASTTPIGTLWVKYTA